MYSLAQLARFDRCLFPDDLADSIIVAGNYTRSEAILCRMNIRSMSKNKKLSVVAVYQEFITDERFCTALEKVLTDFCTK
jgi:hypothetical protein